MEAKDIFILKLSGEAKYKNKKEIYFPNYRDPIDSFDYGKNNVTIQFLNNKIEDYIIRIYDENELIYQDIFKNNKMNGVSLHFVKGKLKKSHMYSGGLLHGPTRSFGKAKIIISYYYKDHKYM